MKQVLLKLKEIFIDGAYISEDEKEFFEVFKDVFTWKTLFVRLPILLIIFYGYCQLVSLAEYLHHIGL